MKFKLFFYLMFVTSCVSAQEKERSEKQEGKLFGNRPFRVFSLDNKLEVLLIHDPDLKKSAAAIDVSVGSYQNPDKYPGLFHFLEHMLFLGSKKYPEDDGYFRFIFAHGGKANAWTDLENTNYHFEIDHTAFKKALDQLAQFFIEPLFLPEYVEKEKNAVDSEYQKNIRRDNRRFYRILAQQFIKGHPGKRFNIGNSQTLKNLPLETLKKFYRTHYSSDKMKLALLSTHSLDKMETWVKATFSNIRNNHTKAFSYPKEAFDKTKQPRMVLVKPIADLKTLRLVFEMPSSYLYWRSKPLYVLSHLIGHEGKGSLLSALKREGLATKLSAKTHKMSFMSLLDVGISLTTKGTKNTEKVIELFFAYRKLIEKEGYKKFIYQEIKVLDDINIKYWEKYEGYRFVSHYANLMQNYHEHPLDRSTYKILLYSQKDFQTCLDNITPKKLLAFLISKDVQTDQKETYYGIDYKETKVAVKYIKQWQEVKVPETLRYPEPNPFMPENLTLHKTEVKKLHKALDDQRGVVWFEQDHVFHKPKAYLRFRIFNPKFYLSAKATVLTKFYLAALTESFNEWGYPLSLAGVKYKWFEDEGGIGLFFEGFSDKLPLAYEKVIQNLPKVSIDEKTFEAIRGTIKEAFSAAENSSALSQSVYTFQQMMYTPSFHRKLQKPWIDTLNLEDLKVFVKNLYNKIAIKGLAYGNLRPQDIPKMIDQLYTTLKAETLPVEERKNSRFQLLPAGSSFAYTFTSKDNNHAFVKYQQFGPWSYEKDAAIRLALMRLKMDFFNQLRTKQQLGYIVSQSKSQFKTQIIGVNFYIQSAKYPSDELAKRTESWQKTSVKTLQKISEKTFENFKKILVFDLSQTSKRMKEHYTRLRSGVFNHQENFRYRSELAKTIQKMSKQEMIDIWKKGFERQSSLAIYHAASGSPKSYYKKETLLKDILELRK